MALPKSFETEAPPFFILGSGRCGTTLFRRQILERTRTVIPPENHALASTKNYFATFGGDWTRACTGLVKRLTRNPEQWRTFRMDGDALLADLLALPDDDKRMPVIWQLFTHEFATAVGCLPYDRWGDKTPMNAFNLPMIDELYPRAQYFCLVRHPLDMARSFGHMSWNQDDFNGGIDRWVKANTAILAFVGEHPDRCRIIKYEDLVTDNERTIEDAIDFLGLARIPIRDVSAIMTDLPVFEHLANSLNPVTDTSVGRGEDLPPEVKTYARDVAGPLAQQFGYRL